MFANRQESPTLSSRDRWKALLFLGLILAVGLSVRLIEWDQPIVENYVGRQIPTAMVARKLERGSGFLWPQLETGPSPNYFLVEPPIYQQTCLWFKRISGLSLPASGRAVSAIGMTLAALGLYRLAAPRQGVSSALIATLVFSAFPITIRYGRSFQPDALMLGTTIFGLSCWDRIRTESAGSIHRWWMGIVGWLTIALGLSMKITTAYMLIPAVIILSPLGFPRLVQLLIAGSTLVPAIAWYLWANHVVNLGEGSLASAGNRTIWFQVLIPTALLSLPTWGWIGRFVLWRSFTPLGPILAVFGLAKRSSAIAELKPIWPIWGLCAAAMLLVLAAKLHHEYYFLAIAPVMAVCVARGYLLIGERSRLAAAGLALGFAGACGLLARSTLTTPAEWKHLVEAGRIVNQSVPETAWVVAPEALLFQADRQGCRLEASDAACRRAAEEWGVGEPVANPAELVEFYRARGARYFADLGVASGPADSNSGASRVALHEAIRRRYKVIVDQPAILLAELQSVETSE